MEAEMSAMFPKPIRTLIIDDDTKFVKSAIKMLAALNFEAVSCGSVFHGLKSLTSGKLEGIDVVLAHAGKVATCGFDFRAIIEADLGIPVVYFLSPDHVATGEEADELLRTLEAATYVIKKPLDADEVRTGLWKVVAWHKCDLEAKAAAAKQRAAAGGGDEGRVHYKVVRCKTNRKRKGGSGGVSFSSGAGNAGHTPAKGQEKDNVGSQQPAPPPENPGRGKKAPKNSGEPFKLLRFSQQQQQPNKAINGQQQQPKPSLFVQSVLRTLNVPPYNPKFYSDFAGPSSNSGAGGASSAGAAPSLLPRPLYSPAPPALLPPAARNFVFGNITPPAAAATMAAGGGGATYKPLFSGGIGNQQPRDARPLPLMFGPFPYQGPLPPVAQQAMVPAGGLFTGGVNAGASAAAVTGAGAYGNTETNSLLQSLNLNGELVSGMAGPLAAAPLHAGDASDEVAMLASLLSDDDFDGHSAGSSVVAPGDQVLGNDAAGSSMAPQGLGAAPNGGSSSSSSNAAMSMVLQDLGVLPDQVLCTASNVNDLTAMAGGASGSSTAASFMAPHQDLGAAVDGGSSSGGSNASPNGGSISSNGASFIAPHQDPVGPVKNGGQHQLAPDQSIYGSLMESHGEGQGTDTAMLEGDDGLMAAMLASDGSDHDNTVFPLEALLDGMQSPMLFNFYDDLDAQMGGGGGPAASDAAGTSLAGGEGGDGMDNWDISDAIDGLEIPGDLWDGNTGDFLFPEQKKKKEKKNNLRE